MQRGTLNLAKAQLLLKKFRAGKLNQPQFCAKHKISRVLFTYWKSRCAIAELQDAPRFQEIIPTAIQSPSNNLCTLTLANGLRLEFPSNMLPQALEHIKQA
jgi:hypothetical protein